MQRSTDDASTDDSADDVKFVDLELAAKKKPPCSIFGANVPHLPPEVCNRIFAYIAADRKARRKTFRNMSKTHFAMFNALWGSHLKIPRSGNIYYDIDYRSNGHPNFFKVVKLTEQSVRVLPLQSTVVKREDDFERQSTSIVYMPGGPIEGAKAKTVGRKKFSGWERWRDGKKLYWRSSDP